MSISRFDHVLRQFSNGTSPFAPAISLNLGASLPTGHEDFRSRHVLPRAKLLGSWNLTSSLNFTGDAGWSRAEADGVPVDSWSSTSALGFTVTSRAVIYSEFITSGTRAADWGEGAFVTAGLSYLLAATVQADLRAGVRTDSPSRGTFYHFGFARTF